MNRTCIVVADTKRARFFSVEESDHPRHPMKLVEKSVLVNPDIEGARAGGARCAKTERANPQPSDARPIEPRGLQHQLELERRFGRDIAHHAGELTADWKDGTIVLIAEPRLLGLSRGYLRGALNPAVELKELAKDYSQITASELRDQLDLEGIVSTRRMQAP